MRYQTIARCTDPDCRCADRAGVVLYDGPNETEAHAAANDSPYTGYHVEVRELK